ncbi:STAS domain-containing protein [Criblamydia sequanensis]|uniref:Anti-sigma factor antagonist n=1 Tax=Candidatus Criblamydia sequanensis CRIB-18 TaxID=1437425 RepID=A0A090D395_9BACT|nr:STAS domain-containing protein [Criblamydia sequanensis]CDR35058.1 Anti-sigma factor antagonist [Criblamydia sequanensis CRIB-18]
MENVVDLKEEQEGDLTILKIKGRLDAISAPNAEKKVFECINNGQHNLLMDFSEVDYLSSAGMRMLLSTTKKLKTLSGRLVLCSVNVNVLDVLKMSGFDHVLDIAQTKDEAKSKFHH